MTPEEKARVRIDQWLNDSGWKVINRDEFEPNSSAVAVREGLLNGNKEADYFLFINGKAIGILEAKREEINPADGIQLFFAFIQQSPFSETGTTTGF